MESELQTIPTILRSQFDGQAAELEKLYDELNCLEKEDKGRAVSIKADIKCAVLNRKLILSAISSVTQLKVSKGE